MWNVSSRSGVATLRTAIHLLLTVLHVELPYFDRARDVLGRGAVGHQLMAVYVCNAGHDDGHNLCVCVCVCVCVCTAAYV